LNIKLNFGTVTLFQARQKDDVGEVFEFKGEVFRGVFSERADWIRNLVEGRFLKELIEKDLFPSTEICSYSDPRYELIIKHSKIERITYPQEWTYSMLKDAALVVLKVAKIAQKHNLNMKDCHSLNVLFDNRVPKFVDLGSFYESPESVKNWAAYSEFLRCYYYPLVLWASGLESTAKLTIFGANLMPHYEFFAFKSKLLRACGPILGGKLIKLRFLLANLALSSREKVLNKTKNYFLRMVLPFFKMLGDLRYRDSKGIERLVKKISKIKVQRSSTIWSGYQGETRIKKARFARLTDLVMEKFPDLNSAIDIAGNESKFSQVLLLETNVTDVVCVDLDEQALDTGYLDQSVSIGESNRRMTFANYNVLSPTFKASFKPPWERFSVDGVFALAVIHHLILGQGYRIEDIFKQLSRYSKKYIFIEFPKNGLWRYGQTVNVPEWYTVDWFKKNFEKHFHLLHQEQLTDSYILFVGKIQEEIRSTEVV
jgi:hypothetical protein